LPKKGAEEVQTLASKSNKLPPSVPLRSLTVQQVNALMVSEDARPPQLPQFASAFLRSSVCGSALVVCEDVNDAMDLGIDKRVFCKQMLMKLEGYRKSGVPSNIFGVLN
jgi:hypothetical protein